MKVNHLYNWKSKAGLALAAGQLASLSVSKPASCHYHLQKISKWNMPIGRNIPKALGFACPCTVHTLWWIRIGDWGSEAAELHKSLGESESQSWSCYFSASWYKYLPASLNCHFNATNPNQLRRLLHYTPAGMTNIWRPKRASAGKMFREGVGSPWLGRAGEGRRLTGSAGASLLPPSLPAQPAPSLPPCNPSLPPVFLLAHTGAFLFWVLV